MIESNETLSESGDVGKGNGENPTSRGISMKVNLVREKPNKGYSNPRSRAGARAWELRQRQQAGGICG